MSELMGLVEDYGILRYRLACIGERNHTELADRAEARKAEIHAKVRELERIEAASRVYATRYVQDEADDPEVCVCPGQHKHAKELIEALSVIEPIRGSWHLDAAMEAANVPER